MRRAAWERTTSDEGEGARHGKTREKASNKNKLYRGDAPLPSPHRASLQLDSPGPPRHTRQDPPLTAAPPPSPPTAAARRRSDARGGTAPVACPRGAGRRLRRGGCVVFTPASEVTAITNKSRGLHPAAAAATVPPNAGTASWRTAVRGRTPEETLGRTEVGVGHWVKGASGLNGSTVASMLREW